MAPWYLNFSISQISKQISILKKGLKMSTYQNNIAAVSKLKEGQPGWGAISSESAARMRLQNRFQTGLDIARYTAGIMRADMDAYDADSSAYTQSLGCWHGFIGQQKLISIKKHFGTTDRKYLYLSGWMVAALRLNCYICKTLICNTAKCNT